MKTPFTFELFWLRKVKVRHFSYSYESDRHSNFLEETMENSNDILKTNLTNITTISIMKMSLHHFQTLDFKHLTWLSGFTLI